ncbi:hypothetical protein MNBD_GAMMA09-2941 [hydrothermal vent metagenome]|uniref:DUF695 domain-containing protein n=1 Tax=hydrothermal vent metagenome TaxID=652676 RepID=A0A3B0XQ27_9ZZZZ
MVNQECWGLYEKQLNDRLIRVRLNEGIEDYVCHPRYMHQVCISVPLNDEDENGFPFPEECKLLDELELLLKNGLEEQQLSVFVAVVTSGGVRLYFIYTSQPDSCLELLEKINADWIYHQLSADAREDRNWQAIEALLQDV